MFPAPPSPLSFLSQVEFHLGLYLLRSLEFDSLKSPQGVVLFQAEKIMLTFMRWETAMLHHLSDGMAKASDPNFPCPAEIVEALQVLVLPYRDFSGQDHLGQMVVHRSIAERVEYIFQELFAQGFPIGSMAPLSAFRWDDHLSMSANNSSGWNYRQKTGKDELSEHAYGLAIDINPLQNPYQRDGIILPDKASYDPSVPGTCTPESLPVKLFKAAGFIWGGEWTSLQDHMHFEFQTST